MNVHPDGLPGVRLHYSTSSIQKTKRCTSVCNRATVEGTEIQHQQDEEQLLSQSCGPRATDLVFVFVLLS